MNWVRHNDSTTWFQTSRYCLVKVEFNSIKWVLHSSSTTLETGLRSFWPINTNLNYNTYTVLQNNHTVLIHVSRVTFCCSNYHNEDPF